MNDKRIIQFLLKRERLFKLTFYLLLFFSLLLFGAVLNLTVTSFNDNKMPVYDEYIDYHYETPTHFYYSNKSEVTYYILSDIFKINFNKRYSYYFSIGDILLYFGLFSVFITAILLIFKTNSIRKEFSKIEELKIKEYTKKVKWKKQ